MTLPFLNDRSSAQQFMEEHDRIRTELTLMKEDNARLRAENCNFLSEVQMLREELERTDKDKTRLQGFSAALVTRLTIIRETINAAVDESLRQGIEAKVPPVRGMKAKTLYASMADQLYPSPTAGTPHKFEPMPNFDEDIAALEASVASASLPANQFG